MKKNSAFKCGGNTRGFVDGICYTTEYDRISKQIDLCDNCLIKLKRFLEGAELSYERSINENIQEEA